MKVICTNDNWNPAPDQKNKPAPWFGEICRVVKSMVFRDHLYYGLSGRFDLDSAFISDKFSPLSFKDETEFVRNYNTQKV